MILTYVEDHAARLETFSNEIDVHVLHLLQALSMKGGNGEVYEVVQGFKQWLGNVDSCITTAMPGFTEKETPDKHSQKGFLRTDKEVCATWL